MESTRSVVCYQADETCTLARDAIRDFVAITYNARGALITYQASFVGLDKKLSNPIGLLNFLEAPPRFELGNKGFADLCLTTWLWRHIEFSRKRQKSDLIFVVFKWSGLRGSNPPPRPWQGRALPNELNPHISPALVVSTGWCLRSELNQRHEDFQSSALPTELQRQVLATRRGLEPLTSSVTG